MFGQGTKKKKKKVEIKKKIRDKETISDIKT